VAAYVRGEAVTWSQLQEPLAEAAGGQVLAEWVLDRALARRLAERGLKVDDQAIAFERQMLLEGLSENADEAARLLRELRDNRGLGPRRFDQLLARNASMRLLVRDEVPVSDDAVREAFDLAYGPRYETRVIVVASAAEAARIARQAREGASFIDLALQHSTDASRAQGGLLPPISLADVTYPDAFRTVLRSLEPGQVSSPIALGNGFALLKLERKTQAADVKLDDVQEVLRQRVRRRDEALAMQRLARTLLEESDPVILNPTLQAGWQQQRRRLGAAPQ
jgi:parvulin-like peptidyl-prolyl isomerase